MLKAAVLLATASLVVALPAGASEAAASKSVTIRVLVMIDTGSVTWDAPPHTTPLGFFTKGDTASNSGILLNAVPQFGKPKGWNVGTFSTVVVTLSSQRVREDRIARFPGGTVHVLGNRTVALHWKLPIVGGTGIYAGATGVFERLVPVTATFPVNIYRLQLP